MNHSIWLMEEACRVDLVRHNAEEWSATLVRVADNHRVATGYAYSMRTAVGELYDALVRLDRHELAEALDRAKLPADE